MSERTLAQEDRLWQRRADLYAQVMRPITEVHAEKTRDIVGDVTLCTDPRPDAMPRYEEELALLPQVDVLVSRPVRILVHKWVDEMRLSYDGDFRDDYVRGHLLDAMVAHDRLADAVRAELGVAEIAEQEPPLQPSQGARIGLTSVCSTPISARRLSPHRDGAIVMGAARCRSRGLGRGGITISWSKASCTDIGRESRGGIGQSGSGHGRRCGSGTTPPHSTPQYELCPKTAATTPRTWETR